MLFKKLVFGLCILTATLLLVASTSDHIGLSSINVSSIGEEATTDFDKVMSVLTHQRCVNCHPSGDKPRKGDDKHVTRTLGIARGVDGQGLSATNCQTCHSDQNNDYSGVPGAPHWALAPASMTWEGKSRIEIAEQMMDPDRNGGRSHHDIMEHLSEHELVLWAWDPGVDAEGVEREKPPVPKDEYIIAVKDNKLYPINYGSYDMALMKDSPKEIDVVLIEGADFPGPVGEPPLGPIGAAIANAVRRLTDQRLTELPLTLG